MNPLVTPFYGVRHVVSTGGIGPPQPVTEPSHWWRIDEGTGNYFSDQGSVGFDFYEVINQGAGGNMQWDLRSWGPQLTGCGHSWNDTYDPANCSGQHIQASPINDYKVSIALWVLHSAPITNDQAYYSLNSGSGSFKFYIGVSAAGFIQLKYGGTEVDTTSIAITPGVPTHIAASVETDGPSELQVYKDGVIADTGTVDTSWLSGSVSGYYLASCNGDGGRLSIDCPFVGTLADVRVWHDYILTPAEVLTVYQDNQI